MIVSELREWLEDREQTYQFLAQAYRAEPTHGFLAGLLSVLHGGAEAGETPGHALLRRWAAKVPAGDLSQVIEALEIEYARLFLVPTGPARAIPYESFYTSRNGMLMQEAAHQVIAAYGAAGMAWQPESREFPDHISVEMQFMARLCSSALEAAAAGLPDLCSTAIARQREFLDCHLLVWVPQFALDVERTARDDFYRAVAQITREFLADEAEGLAKAVDMMGGPK